MDALSDVLKSVHLEGAVFLNAEFSAPWCVRGEAGKVLYRHRIGPVDHMVYFHYITDGSCKVRLSETGDELEVLAGDLVLFPQDDHHLMGSDLQLAPLGVEGAKSPNVAVYEDMVQIRYGGGGATTRFVCGYLLCGRAMSRSLFAALPRMFKIPVGNGPAAALLRELLQAGVRESLESRDSRPGKVSSLAKLADLMFVEALRHYAGTLSHERKGWLAGVRDPQIGRAIALLHARPDHAWTVDELAREVALSRSTLGERFGALVGETPMQYLLRWRLTLAAQTLRSGRDAIARVAERYGYDSEAAFNRAFKREFGVPPAAWRRSAA